ncbi:MAG TPA: twin-arginine translocase TatA/TatE family subunit [Tepidisphaeraceae bacterium]|nr:twin-arginine translocase TatA/TatE family subunit [Tepidisphaeraceae bacterium]
MFNVLAIGMPQGFEWIFIAAIGLLIFGKRLPDVGRSLGQGIVQFKKGLKGVEDDIETESDKKLPEKSARPAIAGPAKYDPYTGKPIDVNDQVES